MAENKPRMTEDLILPPGVVLTPGHEVAEPHDPGATFADRPIFVHEDTEARYALLSQYQRAEVSDVEVLSTAEPSLNDGPVIAATETPAYEAQAAAQRARVQRSADKPE